VPINRPYRRNCRQFVDGSYTEGGRSEYMIHPKYATAPEHYVRAFLILQKDLQELFDFIEPADNNLSCYSYRIHSLLIRTCIEVEANCKAILQENGYARAGDWNMGDYKKIDKTHFLSAYAVKVPTWSGSREMWVPFAAWANHGSLPWYKAYNATKHDRHTEFPNATFERLIEAICGLLVLLSAQFETNDFSPGPTLIALDWPADGMKSGIGSFFRVRFPQNWSMALRYDFDWQNLRGEEDPFQNVDYENIA